MDYVWMIHPALPGQIIEVPAGAVTFWETKGWVVSEPPVNDANPFYSFVVPVFDAKGDLIAGTGDNAAVRVPVGADGTHLVADASQTAGVRWATPDPLANLVNTKGDLLVGVGDDLISRKAVGVAGTVLTSEPSEPTGVIWKNVTDVYDLGTSDGQMALIDSDTGSTFRQQQDARQADAYTRLPVISPKDFGAVGNGVANDRAALQAAVNAAASSGRELWMEQDAVYAVEQDTSVASAGPGSAPYQAVIIPSGVTIRGNGAVVLIKGIDGTKTYSPTPPYNLPGTVGVYNAFQVLDETSDVRISGVTFRGQNNPFSFILGHQAAAIDIDVSTVAGDVHDILVENCTFENLWGFSVHHQSGGHRVHVRNCRMKQVTNTINVNGDYCAITGNSFDNAAVVECSGSYCDVSNNVVKSSPHGGISLGGRISGPYGYGTVCSNNILDSIAGQGIVVADGADGYAIVGNTIRRTAKQGIIATGPTQAVKRLLISGNNIIGAGATAGIASERVGIYVGSVTDCLVVGNIVGQDAALSATHTTHTAFYGSFATGLQLVGNRVAGTFTSDLSLDSAPLVSVVGNNFAANKISRSGTTTYGPSLIGDSLVFSRTGDSQGLYYHPSLPEGLLSAVPGSMAVVPASAVTSGASADQLGFSLWVKERGTGSTGWIPLGGSIGFSTKVANYSIVNADPPLVIFNGSLLTATLFVPATTGMKGRKWTIKNIHSTDLTVNVSGGTNIDGAATKILTQYQSATFVCNGTQWLTI